METGVQIAEWVQTLGLTGGLLVVLWGGAKGWWVFGWQYNAVVQDRDYWRAQALKTTELAEKGLALK